MSDIVTLDPEYEVDGTRVGAKNTCVCAHARVCVRVRVCACDHHALTPPCVENERHRQPGAGMHAEHVGAQLTEAGMLSILYDSY